MSNTDFYKNSEAEFRNWAPGQPDNWNSKEHCTFLRDTGFWDDASCDSVLRTLCSDVRGLNMTFVFINNSMTWMEAQSYCRANYTDLASVTNMSENQKAKELVPAGQKVWIGLFRDSWKWTDGSNSSFRHWNTNEPNGASKETCTAANFGSAGRWEDWNCDRMTAFVCYSDPAYKQVVRLRMEKNNNQDLNDPAVMAAMLEQMLLVINFFSHNTRTTADVRKLRLTSSSPYKRGARIKGASKLFKGCMKILCSLVQNKQFKQKLKNNGVKGDIKLSWRKQSDGEVFHSDEKETKKNTACKN
ncbi:macrophage mannose receptor 1-like isoform X2 [Oreochromis aureus]|uniref:macrophage mannose receptor 1-like isoform X2 n=1 Tax=Oreochromis aureus TaxID=47969 RepID=UPI001953688A|nr:macrophage mannose receptor 1-like isoform X2 [Oreochromis aureus]